MKKEDSLFVCQTKEAAAGQYLQECKLTQGERLREVYRKLQDLGSFNRNLVHALGSCSSWLQGSLMTAAGAPPSLLTTKYWHWYWLVLWNMFRRCVLLSYLPPLCFYSGFTCLDLSFTDKTSSSSRTNYSFNCIQNKDLDVSWKSSVMAYYLIIFF